MAKFNKGDISEGILAAAITARFLSKTKRINNTDVANVIRKLSRPTAVGGKGLTSLTTFPSPNEEPKVTDEVICKVNLAEINMQAFMDQSIYNQTDIRNLVTAAAQFANGRYIMEWADLMYKNNQKNKIEVLSEGLLDQTGTKVDLKVNIDGEQASVGISLKAGDVKQFGQVGGSKFEKMEQLFGSLGVKFDLTFENKYVAMLAEKNIAGCLTLAYTEAVRQLERKPQKTLVKSLADFMKYHATLDEDDVVLVRLNREEANVYDFNKLSQKLVGSEIEIELTDGITEKLQGFKGGNKIPKINFIIKGTKDILFTIRLKLEGNRLGSDGQRRPLVVRSYIEKGKATTKLIMET